MRDRRLPDKSSGIHFGAGFFRLSLWLYSSHPAPPSLLGASGNGGDGFTRGVARRRLEVLDLKPLSNWTSANTFRARALEKRPVKDTRLIRVELPSSVIDALDTVPLSKGAAQDNRRLFAKDSASLFKLSTVAGAHPQRFRHTLASELIAKGGLWLLSELAAILGNSEIGIARYYAKWTPEH